MKNKKKLIIISIIVFIIVVSFIIFGFVMKKELNSNNSNDFSNNKQEIKFPLNIYNFDVDIENKNALHLSFNALNNGNDITKEKIYLNFYNDKELLYTYEYEIIELVSGDSILVEANIDFEFDKITRYEFVYDEIKKEIKPFL